MSDLKGAKPIRNNKSDNLFINAYAEYSINNHLKLRITGGIVKNDWRIINFNDSLTALGNSSTSKIGINGSIDNRHINSWVNENTISYEKKFGKSHHVNLIVGMTEQSVKTSTDGFSAENLPLQANDESWLGVGTSNSPYSTSSSNAIISYLTRFNYDYKSKYLFTATVRADGSSKFAPGNRWGYFPSGAVAWNFGTEDFIKNIAVISDGKLRMSYGITSNNRVNDYAYLSQYSVSTKLDGYIINNIPVPGTIPILAGNQNLKWETTKQWDLGLDLALFENRIKLTADIYRKNTYDLLLNAQIPPSFGYKNIYENAGGIRNQGIEISLNTDNIRKVKFKWNSSFNISFNSNKILALAENQNSITDLFAPYDNVAHSIPAFIAEIGKPLGLMYGPVWEGVYQYSDFDLVNGNYLLKSDLPTNGSTRRSMQPGDVKYKDLNHDGTVDNKDYTVLGRGLPKFTGGFNNNFTFKGFQLNIFFQWSVGNDILNVNKLVYEGNRLNVGVNQFESYTARWQPDNPSNIYFRAGGAGPPSNSFSSRIVEDGSYLRLKTVSLEYNFPATLIKRLRLQSLRIYASTQNLFTWSKYSGFDPEVSIYNNILTPNVDFSAYPRSRTIIIGLNLDF